MRHIKCGKVYFNKRKLLYEIPIVLIILLETCFLSIPVISTFLFKYNNYHDKRIIFVMVFLLFVLTMRKKMKKTKIDFLCIYFFISWIFISIISALIISSPWTIIDQYYYYGIILLYIPFAKIFDNVEGLYEFFQKIISTVGGVYSIYLIIAKYLYDYVGIIAVNENIQQFQIRNGLRMARSSDFLCFAFVVTLCLLVKRKKNKYYINLCVIGGCIFWVGQSRLYQVLIIALILVYLCLYTKINWKILTLVLIVFKWKNIQVLYNNFVYSFYAKETLSNTLARTQGYEIVSKKVFEHMIFGSGFDGNIQFFLGSWQYALSDLGILGFVSVWGILGIVFVGLIILVMLNNLKKIFIKKIRYECSETVFLFVWFVLSCISVSFSDVQRIIYLPFMLLMLRQNIFIIERLTIKSQV